MLPYPFKETLHSEARDIATAMRGWHFWRSLLFTAIGVVIFSIGINGLLIPHHFMAGGITGLSLIVYSFFSHFPVSVIYWFINIPLFIVGWRTMSAPFLVVSIAGVFMSGVGLQAFQGIHIPLEDPLLAAILGGALSGIGIGFYLRVGGSTGGLDIVSTIIRKRLGLPAGITFISFNMLIITLNAFMNSLEIALYTGISMYITGVLVDRMQAGFSRRRSAFIITSQPDRIAQSIMKDLGRGATFFQAQGARAGQDLRVVYTVFNLHELGRFKEILYAIDPAAFVVINEPAEVIGNRFVSWKDERYGQRPLTSFKVTGPQATSSSLGVNNVHP